LVQIPTAQKQVLLATQDATDLLIDIRTTYRREVALMNAIIEHDVAEPEGLFSVN
jgi:hypothetical protein